jgi:hypothetical protein
MTFPLTPTVIALGLSPAGSNACTGTALPINLSNLECRPLLPRRLTQLCRIALDHRSAQTTCFSARTPQPRLNVKRRKAFATIPIVPNLPRLRSIRLL